MRVACIGNMNNNAFALARYLRDRGVDTDVLLLDIEASHFHPASDSYDLSYQPFTRTVAWGAPFGFLTQSRRAVADDLKRYDFLIATGSAPAFVHRAGRTADVFMPFGDDLMVYPFPRLVHPRYQYAYLRFARAQRAGIERSRYFHLDVSNGDIEKYYNRMDFKGTRLTVGVPMVYTPIHNPESIVKYYDRTHWHHEFKCIRDRHDLMVFHHGRHHWKTTVSDISKKANDKLIRGFAAFVKRHPAVRSCLVTVEYGRDVLASKALVAELGIEKHVFWFPQMARKDLMVGLSLADIGTGEFHRSWFSFGTMYESLAMARPFMHYRDDSLYRSTYAELYPLINVHSEADISAALDDYLARPDHYRALGEAGRRWFQKYVIEDVVDSYVRLIEEAA